MPTRTVLVVDASPLSARRVAEALRGTDLSLVVAVNQAEADALIDAGEISVALAAVSFPKGNGYDLARRVRTRSPEAVVFLLCGGFEVFNNERADQVGVYGGINRPFTVDTLRRHLEAAVGPLGGGAAPEPGAAASGPGSIPGASTKQRPADAPEGVEPYDGPLSPAPEPRPAPPRPAVADERVASFLPRDWRSHPPVRVDTHVVIPALERVILEVLPEVVEVVLHKALSSSPAFRDLVEVAVEDAVRAQIGAIARRVIRERLAEIEAGGDEPPG